MTPELTSARQELWAVQAVHRPGGVFVAFVVPG